MFETLIEREAHLDQKIKKTYFDTVFASEDNHAHRVSVHLYRGHEPVSMSGAIVTGYFLRYSDGKTVEVPGSMTGNVASVLLSEDCYKKTGQFSLTIKVETVNEISTVLFGEGSVFCSKTSEAADGDGDAGGGSSGGGEGGGIYFETDATLTLRNGILSVNTADAVERDNTLPVTSAAVYAEVGNINALLATI